MQISELNIAHVWIKQKIVAVCLTKGHSLLAHIFLRYVVQS